MTWLIDSSALVRIPVSPDGPEWLSRVQRGLVQVSTLTRLEVGYSARSGSDLREADERSPLRWMPKAYLTPAIEDRAVQVQRLLARAGQHRAPSVADVLIAATAELSNLTVVHVDKDFELIASVTGQPLERLRL